MLDLDDKPSSEAIMTWCEDAYKNYLMKFDYIPGFCIIVNGMQNRIHTRTSRFQLKTMSFPIVQGHAQKQ